jgi:hypothetical protein
MLKQHKSGQHDNHKVLFSLVILEQWLRINRPIAAAVYGN